MPKKLTDLSLEITAAAIGQYLTEKDKSTLALVSTTTQRLFQPHRLQKMTNTLLLQVMRGEQNKAEKILKIHPELLMITGTATDYSGRKFNNITAYEYAYWAKDTHMCRMLERHMDANIKAVMLEKMTAIETVGLTYEQRGQILEHSKHFDMTPLKIALQNYINGYDAWDAAHNYAARKAAWMLVGLAQRDLPVHVMNEYCRPDRSFHPLPAFNENNLPRTLTYYNFNTGSTVSLFPLVISCSSGLGIDFAISLGAWRYRYDIAEAVPLGLALRTDLAALSHLDEVRTLDLTRSRENLCHVGLIRDLRPRIGYS